MAKMRSKMGPLPILIVILEDFRGSKRLAQPTCKSEAAARRVQGGCEEGARKDIAIGNPPWDIKKKN